MLPLGRKKKIMADLPSDFAVDKNPVDSTEVDVISEPELDFFGKPKQPEQVRPTSDELVTELVDPIEEGLLDDGNDLVVQVEKILDFVEGEFVGYATREEARATGKPYRREIQPNGVFLWITEG